MEDKINISTNYAELHTYNKIHVHIILTSGQDTLKKMVVLVMVGDNDDYNNNYNHLQHMVFAIVNNSFCKKIPLTWLSICKYKQTTTNGLHYYKIIITIIYVKQNHYILFPKNDIFQTQKYFYTAPQNTVCKSM
jgi:hypothetical protein